MPRKTTAKPSPTAASLRKLAAVTVHGGFGHGIDKVHRVVDTVACMAARRQIDSRQRRAADDFRDCFDVLVGAAGGSMDFDKVKGGGTPGAPPAPPQLFAAERLADAKRILGSTDAALVEAIAGHGHTIEEAAMRFSGAAGSLSERTAEYYGRRFRDALATLADHWFPISRKTHIRSHMQDGAKPVGGMSGTRVIEDSRTAHADERRVRFSDQPK